MGRAKDPRAQIRATDDAIEAFLARLNRVIRVAWAPIYERFREGEFDTGKGTRAREAVAQLGSMYSLLDRSGLSSVLDDLPNAYAGELRFVAEHFESIGVSGAFSRADRALIETLIDYDVSKVARNIELYVDDAKAVLMRSVLTGEKPDLSIFDDFDGNIGNHLRTELRTSVQGFNRTLNVRKAKDLGFDLFEYVGPDDDVTRPFCQELLAKDPPIYTLDEIKEMDNGHDLDVFTHGGGYNCRHGWYAISEEDARAEGWKG